MRAVRSVLVIVSCMLLSSCGGDADPIFSPASAGPVAYRSGAAVVSTGERVLVWGGHRNGVAFGDGAVYEPDPDAWQAVSEAPIEARTGALSAWTGSEVVVWGGWSSPGQGGRPLADAAAYDLVTERWRRLPSPPVEDASAGGSVTVGDEILFHGYNTVVSFEPQAERWTTEWSKGWGSVESNLVAAPNGDLQLLRMGPGGSLVLATHRSGTGPDAADELTVDRHPEPPIGLALSRGPDGGLVGFVRASNSLVVYEIDEPSRDVEIAEVFDVPPLNRWYDATTAHVIDQSVVFPPGDDGLEIFDTADFELEVIETSAMDGCSAGGWGAVVQIDGTTGYGGITDARCQDRGLDGGYFLLPG